MELGYCETSFEDGSLQYVLSESLYVSEAYTTIHYDSCKNMTVLNTISYIPEVCVRSYGISLPSSLSCLPLSLSLSSLPSALSLYSLSLLCSPPLLFSFIPSFSLLSLALFADLLQMAHRISTFLVILPC